MSRELTSTIVNALKAEVVRPVTFAKLEFASSTIYAHDSIGTFTWGGQNWLGVGDFGSASGVEEGTDIAPYRMTLTLSGLDPTISNIGTAGTEDYYLRPATIYMGFLDEDEALIEDPDQIWSGKMDVMTITSGETDSISLTCESDLAKVQRSPDLKYTHIQQLRRNPNDLFFEYLQDIEGVKILWKDRNSGNLGVGNGQYYGGGGGGGGGGGNPEDESNVSIR